MKQKHKKKSTKYKSKLPKIRPYLVESYYIEVKECYKIKVHSEVCDGK